jgi:hypothetical protein
MKHVKLFESFDTMTSPEELEQEIDNILQSGEDHHKIARAIRNLSSSIGSLRYDKSYAIKMKKVADWADSLSDEQRDELRAERNEREEAMRAGFGDSPENLDLYRKKREEDKKSKESMYGTYADYYDKKNAEEKTKRDAQAASRQARRSDILDRFAAGEITKEEALASL